MSRPEALQYREACLKYTVKKSERHLLMDVLREIGVEIEGFHSMLEASLIASQLIDLRINEGDQYLWLRIEAGTVYDRLWLALVRECLNAAWRLVTFDVMGPM